MELEVRQPNPAKEAVAVKYNLSTTAAITLYDLTGTAVAALLPIAIGIARKIKRVLMRL